MRPFLPIAEARGFQGAILMTLPKAYDPQPGYKYQILCRHPEYAPGEWEHSEYCEGEQERVAYLAELRLAYGHAWQFKVIRLPRRCWPGRPRGQEAV